MLGGGGNDMLVGGAGRDVLLGEAGDDVLDGAGARIRSTAALAPIS